MLRRNVTQRNKTIPCIAKIVSKVLKDSSGRMRMKRSKRSIVNSSMQTNYLIAIVTNVPTSSIVAHNFLVSSESLGESWIKRCARKPGVLSSSFVEMHDSNREYSRYRICKGISFKELFLVITIFPTSSNL